MPFRKTIVCLANSRKYQGRCVAGLEWNGNKAGSWIRPVTWLPKGVLINERFCGNANGRDPRLLDLIEIEFLAPHPHPYQIENTRIDPGKRWIYRGTIQPSALLSAAMQVNGPLWVNAGSTCHGRNDLIPESHTACLSHSLMLIQPETLNLTLTVEGEKNGEPHRRIRGEFSLCGVPYIFSVTDCEIERQLQKRDPGYVLHLRRPLLCVSVSEVLESTRACYKLIAGVIPTEQ